jgi:hypothetical protein
MHINPSKKSSWRLLHQLHKKKLRTFSDIRMKPRRQSLVKEAISKAERNLFGQMLLVAENRNLQMGDVLAHLLGPLPWAFSSGDGSHRKTNKQGSWRGMPLIQR